MIKNIVKIFKRDVRTVIRNKAARTIIIGLCIMPCLYTLVNVKAIWNPYTSARLNYISIAVVNKDRSAAVENKNINVGNEIVDNLKKNHNIGWKFVNSKEADQGMRDGKYYAEIEIPENFSSDLSSIITDNPKRAQILYKADTKTSPIGTMITESAAKSLVNSIKSNFTYAVNKAIFSSLNVIGEKADRNKSQIINLKDLIIALGDNMDFVTTALGSVNDDANDIAQIFEQLKPVISASGNNDMAYQIPYNSGELVESIKLSLNNSFNNVQINLDNAKADIYRIQMLVSDLNLVNENSNSSNVNSTVDKINYQIYVLDMEVNASINFLQSVNNFAHNRGISTLLNSLNEVKNLLNAEKNNVNSLQKNLNDTNQISSGIKNSIIKNTSDVSLKLIDSINQYNGGVRGQLNSVADDLISSSNSSADILKTAEGIDKQGTKSIDTLVDGSRLIADSSGDLENKLLQFKNPILNVSNKLKLTDNSDIVKIITILQNNPELMGN
ncbi:MAG TPA: YhgE/Pip domain-containing protein, partial [Clostridium sp.]|nr:YhgE/Pip domain-containing protein [Clostridium sp.]